MWRKFLVVGLVLGVSMIFLSAPARAEEMMDEEMFTPCEQADLEGDWKGLAYNDSDSYGNTIWDTFDVEIAANGAVQGGKYTEYEFTENNDGKVEIEKKDKYNITGGTLEIDEDCNIEGQLDLDNGKKVYNVTHGSILVRKDKPKELVLSNTPPDSSI